jgi:hypothetical protein
VRRDVKAILQTYKALPDIVAILGIDELSDEDKLIVARARKIQKFLRALRGDFDHLTAALDDLCARQERIEPALYQQYLRRCGAPPTLFLCDLTSSYLEGQHHALGEYGYHRDGKRGQLQRCSGGCTRPSERPIPTRMPARSTTPWRR